MKYRRRLVTQEDFVAGKVYRSVQVIEAEQGACEGVRRVQGPSAFEVILKSVEF
jgi:hypothetical protein